MCAFGTLLTDGAAAESERFPLAVRRSTFVERMEDFSSVLLRTGSGVYQIESIRLQVASDGRLEIQAFSGWDATGARVVTEHASGGDGRTIHSLDTDLRNFTLGDPTDRSSLVQVRSIRLFADAEGFLSILRMTGYTVAANAPFEYERNFAVPCGLRVEAGCNVGSCTGACGAAPGCPCTGGTGACSGFMTSVCSGDCDAGICNGSVTDCRCVDPAELPVGGGWMLLALTAGLGAVAALAIARRRRTSAM